MDNVDKLAKEFCNVLREWLTPDQMVEIASRNSKETLVGVCHSHDFCDANMAMLEAAKNCGLVSDVDDIDGLCVMDDVWNAAWDKARESGFTL